MKFNKAIKNQEARTENDMRARKSTANACVDLFFKIGASRGKDIIPSFVAAYNEDKDLALRIVQWARDIRGGAGERQIYKDVIQYLENVDEEATSVLIKKAPELGRWDDILLDYKNYELKLVAFELIKQAIKEKNGLAAKWCPRKGKIAVELRNYLGMTPKQYRKTIVGLSDTVEQKMCAQKWNQIDFNKIPSLAHARYRTAFYRNAEAAYRRYVEGLETGTSKVNAKAVYPYDVIKDIRGRLSKTERNLVIAQWNALENFVGDAKIFPMIDVSGSMYSPVAGNRNLACINVAISLGLYLADKNTGDFKDCFLTFSERPVISKAKGDILQKIEQVSCSNWGFNTNLHAAFEELLQMAKANNVPEKHMPQALLILSDMQFDRCAEFDDTAFKMIKRKYKKAGYKVPNIIFWNLNAYDNVPVKFDKKGVALISGFSPSIVKSVLSGNIEQLTPESIMLNTVMIPRYDVK